MLLLESERFRQTDLLLGVERDRKEGPTADSPTLLLSLISSQEKGAGGCHLVLRGHRDLQEAPAPLRAVARWALEQQPCLSLRLLASAFLPWHHRCQRLTLLLAVLLGCRGPDASRHKRSSVPEGQRGPGAAAPPAPGRAALRLPSATGAGHGRGLGPGTRGSWLGNE